MKSSHSVDRHHVDECYYFMRVGVVPKVVIVLMIAGWWLVVRRQNNKKKRKREKEGRGKEA